MPNNKILIKLPAYTIMEIIVTMIVSSLAIGFIIGLYLNNQKALQQYLSVSDIYNQNLNFISTIKTDIENSRYIYETNNGIELININNDIKYEFFENYVVRITKVNTDTFSVFVTNYELLNLEKSDSLIKNINLSLTIDGFEKELSLNKEYTNNILFELNGH